MIRIIDGKRYNTDKADVVAGRSTGYSGDFDRVHERLYRTKKGNWFLAGEGGARSRYAQRIDANSSSGGEGLFPLHPESARAWLESNGETAAIEKYFESDLEDA